jgi:probable rRNA maturation factor
MDVLFDNSTDFELDEKLIETVVEGVLKYENAPDNCEVSFSLVNNEEIHELNRTYRGIDRPTDVLSFPLIDFENEGMPDGRSTIVLGDIIISIEKAQQQAEEYGHSLKRELAFLTAHSMLHLLGYDHMVEDEERVMFQKQEEILAGLGITR